MTDLDKKKILDHLSAKRNAYNSRLMKCKEANDYTGVLNYEVRLKPVTDFIVYLNKIEGVDRDKFIKRINQKKKEYRSRRDTYDERGLEVDSASCEISVLPLDRLLMHIVWGDFDVESVKQGKDDSILNKSSESTEISSETSI